MDSKLFNDLFENWQQKQTRFQKNRKGRYLHFDRRISFEQNKEWFYSYFKNGIINIRKHSFYPFIKSNISTPRVRFEFDERNNKKIPILDPKIRPIAYASHFDSSIYSWYSEILTYYYQIQLPSWKIDDCVLAYLKKDRQCNIDFANEVFHFIKKKINENNECVALAFDLSSFFDNLDHSILKEQWCKVLGVAKLPADHYKIYQTLTNYSFIEKEYLDIRFPLPMGKGNKLSRICEPEDFRKMIDEENVIKKNPFTNTITTNKKFGSMCGIPQGSPLSSTLSNIYMINFDILLNSFAKKKGGLYRRYCDDLMIICQKKDLLFFEHLVNRTINRLEVTINPKKTEKIFFSTESDAIVARNEKSKIKKLQYLGFEFDGNSIYIRSSSMSRYHRRMMSNVNQAVEDAYDSEFSQGNRVFRKKLYKRFTSNGKNNFIKYGLNSQRFMNNSSSIKKQIKGSINKLEKTIVKSLLEKEKYLKKINKESKNVK